jgi:hypothetical protein
MGPIFLIHWNNAEAGQRVARLTAMGFEDVRHIPITGPGAFRAVRDLQPSAVVIDLSRLPSHGREIAIHLRRRKPTRHVPLVFVDGEPEKIQRIKTVLPDAVYTTGWTKLKTSLSRAIKSPVKAPVVPKDGMAGYSGTPLPKKLGIKPDSVVALSCPPEGFVVKTLGKDMPAGVKFIDGQAGKRDLTICFFTSSKELRKSLPRAVAAAEHGPVWFAWPKKTSGVLTDLHEQLIRDAGLDAGLVDYKICAIDATWSGLLFCKRRRS